MTVVLDPVDVSAPGDLDPADPLTHWCDWPYEQTLCGRSLRNGAADVISGDGEVNCVVCASLAGEV